MDQQANPSEHLLWGEVLSGGGSGSGSGSGSGGGQGDSGGKGEGDGGPHRTSGMDSHATELRGPSRQRSRQIAKSAIDQLKLGRGGSSGDENRLFEALRQRSLRGDVSVELRCTFLARLATALHAYGSSAARTEFLLRRAAERLEVDLAITVFPTLVLLSFGNSGADGARPESVLLTVNQSLHLDRLGRVDALAQNVGSNEHEILVAFWQLRALARAPPSYGPLARVLAFTAMAAAAGPLFFGGTLLDALASAVLGLILGCMEHAASTFSPVAMAVIEFLSSTVAAFLTRVFMALTPRNTVCFYPTVLSSVVWYLPGLELTVGVNELVAKALVTGTSHVAAAVFNAFQLGFGVAVGSGMALWQTEPLSSNCAGPAPDPPLWAKGLWLCLFVLGSNVLVNSRKDQWLGMTLVAALGFAVSELAIPFGNEAASILAAFAISVSGTLLCRLRSDFPLAMKTAGILVLEPGGIGVSGTATLLQDRSRVESYFVFRMLLVALAITLGLILGKIIFPEALFGYSDPKDQNRVAQDMSGEYFIEELDETMAF